MIDFFFSFKILVAKYALIRFHFKLIILIFEIHYLVKFEKMIQFRFFFYNNRNNKRIYQFGTALS